MGKDLYELGEIPPIGEVPTQMHAQLVRPDRYGEPEKAIQDEVIDVPELGPHDALVMVMAAGVNFNNVWAARGVPVDVTKTQARWDEPTDFHIVGSDASGVVYAVGDEVTNVQVGDRVVVHAGQWNLDDPWVTAGQGSRARRQLPGLGLRHVLGLVRAVLQGAGAPVPAEGRLPHVGGGRRADAHRRDRLPHALRLATAHRRARRRRARLGRERRARLARRAARRERGRPRRRGREQRREGRVREAARRGRLHQPQGLLALGRAAGVGQRPSGRTGSAARRRSARRSGTCSARRRRPRIVFDHPGEDTIPTSIFVADRGGMVVICAGTQRLRHDGRRALPLDDAEALPGLAPVQRRAGGGVQPARDRRQGRARRSARSTPTSRAGTCTS